MCVSDLLPGSGRHNIVLILCLLGTLFFPFLVQASLGFLGDTFVAPVIVGSSEDDFSGVGPLALVH